MTRGEQRFLSREDLARMQARFANQGGLAMSDNQSGVGIKRRHSDNTAVKDLAAEVHEIVSEAIDLAEATTDREARLQAAGSRRAPNRVQR